MKKSIFLCVTLLIFISGCSIRETDPPTERFAKHTINAPVYIVLGVGYVAQKTSEFAVQTILFPPFYIYNLVKNDENISIEKREELK